MTYSAAARVFLPVALAVTVTLKVRALQNLHDDGRLGVREAISLLPASGLRIVRINRTTDPVELDAADHVCDLRLYVVSPHGWHIGLLRELAGAQKRLRFIYDGIEYVDQPVWSTWRYYQWWQINNLLGRRLPIRPVLALIEPSQCKEAVTRLEKAEIYSG